MNLLLLGATGLVGRHVLAQALANPAVTRVTAPTRRPLEPHSKLTNPVSDRLEALLSEGINEGIGGVVCALGTTLNKSGSKEAFREVDYALPLKLARAAHQHGVDTFVLVSASTASADSAVFYSRVKGEVERDIGLVGFKSLTIVRPSLIGGQRDERRLMEHITLQLLRILAPILPKRLQINPADRIAAACLKAVMASDPGFHIRNAESLVAG
jgi:uncharacterized protein YbjT (DUF2867 family)